MTARALGAVLAVGSVCSMAGAGPRCLAALAVAADGIAFSLGAALLSRARQVPGARWLHVVWLGAALLVHVSALVGAAVLLFAALPYMRARTHGDVDLSSSRPPV